MSVYNKNELAYTFCSDWDTVLPDNYINCVKLSKRFTKVHRSHSTVENISGFYFKKQGSDIMLKFLE